MSRIKEQLFSRPRFTTGMGSIFDFADRLSSRQWDIHADASSKIANDITRVLDDFQPVRASELYRDVLAHCLAHQMNVVDILKQMELEDGEPEESK